MPSRLENKLNILDSTEVLPDQVEITDDDVLTLQGYKKGEHTQGITQKLAEGEPPIMTGDSPSNPYPFPIYFGVSPVPILRHVPNYQEIRALGPPKSLRQKAIEDAKEDLEDMRARQKRLVTLGGQTLEVLGDISKKIGVLSDHRRQKPQGKLVYCKMTLIAGAEYTHIDFIDSNASFNIPTGSIVSKPKNPLYDLKIFNASAGATSLVKYQINVDNEETTVELEPGDKHELGWDDVFIEQINLSAPTANATIKLLGLI